MATINFKDYFDGNYGAQMQNFESFELIDNIKDYLDIMGKNMDDDSFYDMATIGFAMAHYALSQINGAPIKDKDFMDYAQEYIIS